jgi:hypothetical protein
MKITVYNDSYEFSEKLNPEYVNAYIPTDFPEFDCLITDIKSNHPFAFGWIEVMSDIIEEWNFTHIKFKI